MGRLSYDGGGGEEVGVVAAFLEVHDDVQQRDLVPASFGVQRLEVFRQDEFVILPANRPEQTFTLRLHRWGGVGGGRRWDPFPPDSLLHRAELHSDDELRLGGHVFEDVGLQPPEHVRTQHVVQLLDLVLLRDVGELLQEDFQFTADRNTGESLRRRGRRVRDSMREAAQKFSLILCVFAF